MPGALGLEQRHVFVLADDVDQRNAVRHANAIEHLAEIGSRRCMDDGPVAFGLRRLDEAERGQGIDEGGGSVPRIGAVRQRQAKVCRHHPILREHAIADSGHGLAQQGPRLVRGTGSDHDAAAFAADRHRRTQTSRQGPQDTCGDRRGQDRQPVTLGAFRGGQIGTGEEQELIRWIDRRRRDLDKNLIISRRRNAGTGQGQLEFSIPPDERCQRNSRVGKTGHSSTSTITSPWLQMRQGLFLRPPTWSREADLGNDFKVTPSQSASRSNAERSMAKAIPNSIA